MCNKIVSMGSFEKIDSDPHWRDFNNDGLQDLNIRLESVWISARRHCIFKDQERHDPSPTVGLDTTNRTHIFESKKNDATTDFIVPQSQPTASIGDKVRICRSGWNAS